MEVPILDFATTLIEWLTGVWSFLFDFMAAIPGAIIASAIDNPWRFAALFAAGFATGIILMSRRARRNR